MIAEVIDNHSNLPNKLKFIRHCWQITFIMLNRFCLLSVNPPPPLPVLNGKHQVRWNIPNKIKWKIHFYRVFQVLKVLLVKCLKIWLPVLITFCLTSVFTSAAIIFYNFSKLLIFVTNLPFLMDSPNLPTPLRPQRQIKDILQGVHSRGV